MTVRPSTSSSRWSITTAALAATVLLSAAGCGGADEAPTAGGSGTSTSPSPGAPDTSGPVTDTPPSPSESVAPVPDPTAPATIAPAERPGGPTGPRQAASPASVGETVRYPDGVRLKVTDVTPGEVTGTGPGVLPGPTTTFAITLANDSSTRVDLGTVVVTLVYGDPGLLARPTYEVATQDLSGYAGPGSTRRASYAFAVGADDLSSYSLHVDVDGVHEPAVFTGSTG